MFYGVPPRVHTGGTVARRIANVRDRKVFEFFGKSNRDTLDLSTGSRYVSCYTSRCRKLRFLNSLKT